MTVIDTAIHSAESSNCGDKYAEPLSRQEILEIIIPVLAGMVVILGVDPHEVDQ